MPYKSSNWIVEVHADFEAEITTFSDKVRKELFATAAALKELGPNLGRPYVDTLKASRHPKMKELRFNADNGVWRVAFAFDPDRKAILLVAGNKKGRNQKRFYTDLIAIADKRFDEYQSSS